MADLLTDDELDLTDEERDRRKAGESIGTPLPEENMRLVRMAGGMSGAGSKAEVPTTSSKLPDTLTPSQPESIGTPIQGMQPANAPRPAYERYQALSAEKQKPWSALGFGGKVGRVAESIGTAINPNIVAAIPGTAAHHQKEVGQARTAAEEERNTITGESEEQLRAAQAEEQRALAEKNRRPETAGKTPEETTIHDLMTGNNGQPRVNPKTQQPYTYMDAYTDVMNAKNATKPEKISTKEDLQHRLAVAQEKGDKAEVQRLQNEMWTIDPESRARFDESNRQKSSARSDKSFQYNNTALDKVSTPIDQLNQRMGRLQDSLNQNTPQADALIAPELLSVMSGGQGSGLRMNEAEISRIVGGRSKWESLKAAINQWSLDPKAALSITPEQRQEIRALAKTVQDKLIAKEKLIDDARNALIDSDDPKEHRKIVSDTKRKLDAIDAATAEQGGSLPDGGGKKIDLETAKIFLKEAGGDKQKAAQLAKQHNWTE